ncbi:hypothetical protein DZB91_24050 [Brevibacillus sp. VP]|uniref:hypothetical protein n=1 Tax=Brevibacillus sp. VP TaxID=2293326 RepID=UPI000E2E4ED9|nr:hypothetical protein [Brevibacillus sp. VP]RFB28276.1 hypothetical protein DZB91_24050 [Brevibacillus sp. VP]
MQIEKSFERPNLKRINWYIFKDQDDFLNDLQRSGRPRSEHVRLAVDFHRQMNCKVVMESEGTLVKRGFKITAEQKKYIEDIAYENNVDLAFVLRDALHVYQKYQLEDYKCGNQ